MSLPILSMATPSPPPSHLSFSSRIVSDPTRLFLNSSFSHLSIAKPPKSTPIRMGGGPRTFPGGVSKWQWKRMQAKKAKQLLRARLARERQIYEMRKRAELSAAVSELERPWEVVEKAPKLFSTTADEQVKVLADRFQKPGGFDLWSEKDGPQLFESVEGVPSSRFFPKGVVHSIKPYGYSDQDPDPGLVQRNGPDDNSRKIHRIGDRDPDPDSGLVLRNGYDETSRNAQGNAKKNDGRRQIPGSDPGRNRLDRREMGRNGDRGPDPDSGLASRNGYDEKSRNSKGNSKRNDGRRRVTRSDPGRDGPNHRERGNGLNSKLFDMSLQDDGSYGILKKEMEESKIKRRTQRN